MKKKSLYTTIGLLFILTNLFSQMNNRKYSIPKGQVLYSNEIKGNENLKPYKKISLEEYDGKTTKVIETGDFVVQRIESGTKIEYDTLSFRITSQKIFQGDTITEAKTLELKKKLRYNAIARLRFTEDTIFVLQTEDNSDQVFLPKSNEYVHPVDKKLYYKIGRETPFRYHSFGVQLTLIGTPMKIRNSAVDSIPVGEFKINNIGLLIGLNNRNYSYENGKLKKRGFTYGPFIGFSSIKLNNANTLKQLDSEQERLGIVYGGAIVREINNFNIGLCLGFERIIKNDNSEWIFNKKQFAGIVFGYTLN